MKRDNTNLWFANGSRRISPFLFLPRQNEDFLEKVINGQRKIVSCILKNLQKIFIWHVTYKRSSETIAKSHFTDA